MPLNGPVTAAGKRAAILTAGAALLLTIAGCSMVRSSSANASDTVGTTVFPPGQRPLMPAVSGRTLTGQELRLAADHGQVIVLNFWGSWCTVCRQEAPALAVAAQQLKPSGVQFVGVDVADNTASAKAYIQQYGIGNRYDPGSQPAARSGAALIEKYLMAIRNPASISGPGAQQLQQKRHANLTPSQITPEESLVPSL